MGLLVVQIDSLLWVPTSYPQLGEGLRSTQGSKTTSPFDTAGGWLIHPPYTSHMPPRTVPLYDPTTTPSTWCERMSPGEFTVHTSGSTTCAIFPSLPEAETFAATQVSAAPTLRCRIYDHQGFVGAPLREFIGPAFRGDTGLSPRYLRILGLSLLIAGGVLFAVDWLNNYRYGWPGFLGARFLIFGLLVTAIAFLTRLHEFQKARSK